MKVMSRLDMNDVLGAPEEARRLEALGYDGLAAHELSHDTLLRLMAAASATSKVSLESRATIAFPHSPMAMGRTPPGTCRRTLGDVSSLGSQHR